MVDHFKMVWANCGLKDFLDLGSVADLWQFGPDPDPDPDPAIFISDLQDGNQKFFCLLLFEATFILFYKD